MAEDPEARSQLARLLRDESLRHASEAELRDAIDAGFSLLIEGLVAEAAAADDVFDRASALSFLEMRIEALSSVLSGPQGTRLRDEVTEKINAW